VRDVDDVDARDDVKDAEEALVGDDEVKESEFMAFNLDKERQEGYFDDDGNYVEYAEERDEADLWLEKDAKVDERLASGAIKRSTAALEEEEGATSMSEREVAVVQREIAGYLNPGETVLGALKRLGGNTKKNGGRRDSNQGKPAKVMTDEEKKVFDKLTELSSALMGQGEYEVYTFRKEAFERAANMYAPTTALTEASTKDMFADSDDDEKASHEPSPPVVKKAKVEPKVDYPPPSSELDFALMSVKNIKAYIQAHGGSIAGNIAEKSELISRATMCKPVVVPEGYAWSADDGMYYCQASDLFYDHNRRLFTDKHKYWTYDQEKGFVEWTA
jgi:CD2 antigen cytoplasmic tail-binding protein 2